MLTVNNISFEFGGRYLYKNATWQINPGEKIGLVGLNGTGKSTLLRIINGEYQSETGEISKIKNLENTAKAKTYLEYKSIRLWDSMLLYLKELAADDTQLQELSNELADLRKKLPNELVLGEDGLAFDDPAELRRRLTDVESLLLNRITEDC